MTDVHILGIDLAKRSFQICATSPGGAVLFNQTGPRAKLEALLREQAACIVAMEANATSHFWGRFAQTLEHDIRPILANLREAVLQTAEERCCRRCGDSGSGCSI